MAAFSRCGNVSFKLTPYHSHPPYSLHPPNHIHLRKTLGVEIDIGTSVTLTIRPIYTYGSRRQTFPHRLPQLHFSCVSVHAIDVRGFLAPSGGGGVQGLAIR